jgi:hypothetical protein
MKPKQLANVLIKILGFSMCLYAVPTCISGTVFGLSAFHDALSSDIVVRRLVITTIASGIQAVIGIAIICMSEKIANWLLKNAEE